MCLALKIAIAAALVILTSIGVFVPTSIPFAVSR